MNPPGAARREFSHHPRTFADHRYVYAVVSRRSGGISIGVNLNADKRCNFDCIYCQVDRTEMPAPEALDLHRLETELSAMIDAVIDGSLLALPRFADLPDDLRQVRDIALSGDGEPTDTPTFPAAVDRVLAVAARLSPPLPVVLITNAAALHRPTVAAATGRIAAAGGAIWGKLDAGTADYFARVCATRIPLTRVLENLAQAAHTRPLTLQSCLFELDGQPPPTAEIDAYADRVRDIHWGPERIPAERHRGASDAGGLLGIQLYTVARRPAQGTVSPLSADALTAIADVVRARVPGLPVATFI